MVCLKSTDSYIHVDFQLATVSLMEVDPSVNDVTDSQPNPSTIGYRVIKTKLQDRLRPKQFEMDWEIGNEEPWSWNRFVKSDQNNLLITFPNK